MSTPALAFRGHQTWLELLDDIQLRLLNQDAAGGMDCLHSGLRRIRRDEPDLWRPFIEAFRAHPVFQLVQQGPVTHAAFEKARGYAGDAGTLDYIYANRAFPGNISALGMQIYEWELNGANCRSVRARRDIVARSIDDLATLGRPPRVLSIACGHLREASCAEAVVSGNVHEFIGVDQDAKSLEEVRLEYGDLHLTTVVGSVRSILTGKTEFFDLDMVYASGLFDYLGDPTATRLLTIMFRSLRSGGRLLVMNFAPDCQDQAYMEACMDWWLIYRDETRLDTLTREIDPDCVRSKRLFRDPFGNIVFLEMRTQ